MSGTQTPATNDGQRQQAVTGVTPPQVAEALVREVWPSLLGSPVPGWARLAARVSDTIVLRPVAWLMLLPLFLGKITPFAGKLYRLTNRRLMVVRFGRTVPSHEVPLADIDDVRIEANTFEAYYRAANLEVLSKGQVALRLPGVPEPESFRLAILNACNSWAPRRPKGVMPAEKDAPTHAAR